MNTKSEEMTNAPNLSRIDKIIKVARMFGFFLLFGLAGWNIVAANIFAFTVCVLMLGCNLLSFRNFR